MLVQPLLLERYVSYSQCKQKWRHSRAGLLGRNDIAQRQSNSTSMPSDHEVIKAEKLTYLNSQ
jgi:hypothetical protein